MSNWRKKSYTDFKLVKAAKTCPNSHPEEVLAKTWPGMSEYCDCR